MSRVLFWVVMAGLAWWAIKRWLMTDQTTGASTRRPSTAPAGDVEPMVACARCGVHLPRQDTVQRLAEDGSTNLYCSEEHARQSTHGTHRAR